MDQNDKKSSYKAKTSIQSKLSDIDKILDQGGSNEEILSDRSLFFHGILNSKCSQLAIRGTLVHGEWIVDPLAVKNVLSLEQQADLERNISNEEIKSVVWDFGMNKSLGPDDFTFEFFRRYWKLLEHDIMAA
ncbi:hypothetical protein Tco_0839147 [Tanacetum coccineum]|uniref:RNA-directed DNA polymerase, eukaryota, reverse transcriptase zinc-binding domain protein n=1 Tax=Tanacetum coccineum TaxID=301880 RepID=A0ABQ5APU3_9ASTR